MKAMSLRNTHAIEESPLQLSDILIPEIGESELLVRVHTCGICHTDLHIIAGELFQKKSPLTLGHQVVGIIEKVGLKVANHKVGERVGIPWLNSTCGLCEFCIRGQENLCHDAKFTGYDVDGGYAEYIIVNQNYAYSLSDKFSDESAAPLLCAGVIGFRSMRLSNVESGGRLGLIGFGASAHIVIQVARYWNCETYVFSRNDKHRLLAEQLGATWTGTPDDVPNKYLDSVISFAPVGDVVPKGLKILRKAGTLVLAGIYMSSIPKFDYNLLYHEKIIRSVANSTRKDVTDFLKLAEEIPVKTEVELFQLKEANRALQLLKMGKINGAGVLKISV
jgi:alcohol dehydrogenase, propanol-preferring